MLFPVKARRSGPRIREVEYKELNLSEVTKPYKVVCDNCFTEAFAYKNAAGDIKFRCLCCGCMITLRRLSNRHINKDIWSPK